ncbi:MAG: hypothetical protein LBG95_07115 [Treponema sp.]|nr:hypothetical protein [Treponema sp.]
MSNRRLFTALFFLCAAALLPAGGNKETAPASAAEGPGSPVIQVTGVVRLVGSSRFTQLVITSTEDQWFIAREEMNQFHDLQQRTVTVEGEESFSERRFANGEVAGIQRELRNIKIIAVESDAAATGAQKP